jgi:hypothetical protein
MIAILSLIDVPGPAFRRVLRRSLRDHEPLHLVVDARTTPSPSLDRIAVMLRLTRRIRRRGGSVVVVVDEMTHQRLAVAGIHHWLQLARTINEGIARNGYGVAPDRLSPIAPATTKPIDMSLTVDAASPSASMPTTAVPAAPSPVQTA